MFVEYEVVVLLVCVVGFFEIFEDFVFELEYVFYV